MLNVNSISVITDGFKLQNISFKIENEKTHVIIGPTGSGKTMLLETIIGFRKINSGSIIINNKNTENTAIENRDIAYVPQDLALFPHLSVKENIVYSQKINKKKKYDKKLVKRLVEATGINHLMERKIDNLSGGEKQRVALVRALISENKLLILDEPFSAINETTKNELRYLLKLIQKEFKLTILSVTHDLDEAFFLSDTISIISSGKILQTAEKKQLYYNPASVKVAKFLGISNIFDATIKEIHNNSILIDCKQLHTKLIINNISDENIFEKNEKMKFGIRKSDIMILRDDLLNSKQSNILLGTVELIIEKVSFSEIVVLINNSNKSLFIEIPTYAFNKLKIKLNKKIRFTLKSESIFIMNKN